MLNGYSDVQYFDLFEHFIEHKDKINFIILDNSRGDAAKFYYIQRRRGWIFTCDDDLEYPPNYVNYTIRLLKLWGNVVISYHGRTLRERPISSYYAPLNRIEAYRCLGDVPVNARVDVGGTGVMAFHSDTIKGLHYNNFKAPNMADIWMALWCEDSGVKIIVPKHTKGWIKYLDPEHKGKTIFDTESVNDKKQTEIWNRK